MIADLLAQRRPPEELPDFPPPIRHERPGDSRLRATYGRPEDTEAFAALTEDLARLSTVVSLVSWFAGLPDEGRAVLRTLSGRCHDLVRARDVGLGQSYSFNLHEDLDILLYEAGICRLCGLGYRHMLRAYAHAAEQFLLEGGVAGRHSDEEMLIRWKLSRAAATVAGFLDVFRAFPKDGRMHARIMYVLLMSTPTGDWRTRPLRSMVADMVAAETELHHEVFSFRLDSWGVRNGAGFRGTDPFAAWFSVPLWEIMRRTNHRALDDGGRGYSNETPAANIVLVHDELCALAAAELASRTAGHVRRVGRHRLVPASACPDHLVSGGTRMRPRDCASAPPDGMPGSLLLLTMNDVTNAHVPMFYAATPENMLCVLAPTTERSRDAMLSLCGVPPHDPLSPESWETEELLNPRGAQFVRCIEDGGLLLHVGTVSVADFVNRTESLSPVDEADADDVFNMFVLRRQGDPVDEQEV